MKKTISIITLSLLLATGSQVFAMGEKVAVKAIEAAADVAKTAILADKTETTLTNVDIKNDTDISNAGVFGNAGVSMKGDKLKATNVKIKNKTKIKNAIVVGNAGVDIGGK